jgi:hypothetical protein
MYTARASAASRGSNEIMHEIIGRSLELRRKLTKA